MNKKNVIKALIFVGVCLILAVFSRQYAFREDKRAVRGQYVFADTKENIRLLQHIRLTAADGEEANIFYENGEWLYSEAADYFINVEMLANFIKMVNSSIIMTVQDGSAKAYEKSGLRDEQGNDTGIRIETFDNDGVLLDDVRLGKITESGNYCFAKSAKLPYIYSISEAQNFSAEGIDWLPYPLLKIDRNFISGVDFRGQYISENVIAAARGKSEFLEQLFSLLAAVDYEGIIYKSDFAAAHPNIVPQTIKIKMSGGMNYVFDVYFADETYWLAVRLEQLGISNSEVPAFVARNQKYFAEWLFVLPESAGKFLYETSIGKKE